MKKRFFVLRIPSLIYKVLGWVVMGLSIIAGLFLLFSGEYLVYEGGYYFIQDMNGAKPLGLAILVGGIFIGLTLLAWGESVRVALEIEKNTRETALLLEKLLAGLVVQENFKSPPSEPGPSPGSGVDRIY